MKRKDRSWVEINLNNFEDNINALKPYFKDKTYLQIVKADAYGHGAYQIATKAIKLGAKFLGVANYQEGLLLRFQKIDIPILILSPSLDSEILPIVQYDLIPSVQSVEFAQKLNDYAKIANKTIDIHINIDTGMGRSGFYYNQALQSINKIKRLSNLNIQGIFSHYAASENDPDYSLWQYNRFKKILDKLDFTPEYIHISNSSGIVNLQDSFTNMVRLGLLSYGIYTDKTIRQKVKLKPVMSFYTKIGHIKFARKGESIGYNRTFIAQRDLRYAILPIGYADGYDFLLSNKGKVLYKGKLCNILGKVSMDMIAIDISQIQNPKVGDDVQLMGENNLEISTENLTSLYSGSPYELLCQIGRRAKRYFIDKKEIIDSSPILHRDFVPSDYSAQKLSHIIETAISHRIKSEEISAIIYKDFLERFFTEKDKNIHYRENFEHIIEFMEKKNNFYKVKTSLKYKKILTHDYFYVKCAKNEKILERFFTDPFVEYRWLLDSKLSLNEEIFNISEIKINNVELDFDVEKNDEFLSVRCYGKELKDLIGQNVEFLISTTTLYPADSHQLSVYINELTKNIKIDFKHNNLLKKVEIVPFFTGNARFPDIKYQQNEIIISTKENEWVLPNSGVVFAF